MAEEEKKKGRHIAELIKVAPEDAVEVVAEDDRVMVSVDKKYIDEWRGKIVTYIPLEVVKKAVPVDISELNTQALRACGASMFLMMKSLWDAKEEYDKGNKEEAAVRLIQAAMFADRAAENCAMPEMYEFGDRVEVKPEEEVDMEKVGLVLNEYERKFLGVSFEESGEAKTSKSQEKPEEEE